MPHFPQLVTGAMVQYPLEKERWTRAIANAGLDGGTVRVADPDWETVRWELALSGLSTSEWNAIESLFQLVEGRRGTFTFLDPTDNLLARSEEFSVSPWVADPLLQFISGIADPLEGTGATRITNTAQAVQTVKQAVAAPGTFHYNFSIYARSQQPEQLTLRLSTATFSTTRTFALTSAWARMATSGKLQTTEEPVSFSVELQPGSVVEVFGAQAQAQLGASSYRKTLARGGVYPNARFADDRLTVVTEGPDQHSSRIRIVSRMEG